MSRLYHALNLGAAADADRFASAFAERWDPAVELAAGGGAPYVATTRQLLTACRASAHDAAGELRPPRAWDPVVAIDERRVRAPRCDLSVRRDEVLLAGPIPGEAIVRLYSVPEVMATLHAADPAFIDALGRTVLSPSGTFLSLSDEVLCAAAPGILRALSQWWLAAA